jgi:hypothetical protein
MSSQPILALGALVLASLLAYGSRNHLHRSERSVQRVEIETVLAHLADDSFDRLADLPFDENSGAQQESDLTVEHRFGGVSWDTAGDLDDIHGTSQRVERAVGAQTIPVDVEAEVAYVAKQGDAFVPAPSGTQTLFKRVRLGLSGPHGATVQMERVYALDAP